MTGHRHPFDLNAWLAREALAERRREKLAARKARLDDAKTWSGYRSAHYAKSTGALIVVVDGFEAGLESDRSEPRWATVCDDHDTLIFHDTLTLAKSHASCPEDWCESCREGEPRHE